MTIKGDKVTGLNIISINTGEKVYSVKELIYDPMQNKVLGFLVDEGGWFSDAKVILIEDVKSIGEDALMIESEDVVKKVDDIQGKVARIADEGHYLTHTNVVTESGTELGKVTDIFFDSVTGDVREFEVSQGVVKDIKSGKKRFTIEDIITVGEHATIVRSFTEVDFDVQSESGGLTGTLHKAKEKASETFEDFKEQATEAKETITEKSKEGFQNAKEYANSPEVQQKKENFQEKLEEVKNTLENKVEQAKEKKDDLQIEAKEKFNEVKDSAENKKNSAGEFIDEKKDEAVLMNKTNRIDEAVGKYVTVNILTGNDEMLLKRGDLITYEVMRKAEELGLTQKIISNVSTTPVRS
jgi:uncharacterized protein YrrD